jgi:hypothetical protein
MRLGYKGASNDNHEDHAWPPLTIKNYLYLTKIGLFNHNVLGSCLINVFVIAFSIAWLAWSC